VYWVDAAKPLPPTRLAQLPEMTPTLRFLQRHERGRCGAKTIEQIRGEGACRPGINLGAVRSRNGDSGPGAPGDVLGAQAADAQHRPAPDQLAAESGEWPGGGAPRLAGNSSAADGVKSWVIDDVSLGGLGAQVTIESQRLDTHRRPGRHAARRRRQLADGRRPPLCAHRAEPGIGRHRDHVEGTAAVFADAGGLPTEALLLDVPEVGEYARMACPPMPAGSPTSAGRP
jgi:hypothetical protein